jgi:hypothetical protein
MSRLFAKYRCLNATIRIESAISTAAGGQYAAFFDPNPTNNWVQGDAVGALTSMPVQDTAASWECLRLDIPAAELERETELYTATRGVENLVTRFGQFVLLSMAVPNVTPVGTAEVTIWLDATWEFYEPNANTPDQVPPVELEAGNWAISTTTGVITFPAYRAQSAHFAARTAYRLHPELPSSFVTGGEPTPYVAFYTDGFLYAFADAETALSFAASGTGTKLLGGGTPSQNLPATVAVALQQPLLSVTYPYKLVWDDAPEYSSVPVVDVLNIQTFYGLILQKATETNTLLTAANQYLQQLDEKSTAANEHLEQLVENTASTNTKLDEIYSRLHDVKVSSFVDVRLLDSVGLFPIPATEAGLLVIAAAGTTYDVTVVNTVPVTIDGTVPVSFEQPVSVTGDVFIVNTTDDPVPVTGAVAITVDTPVPVTLDPNDSIYVKNRVKNMAEEAGSGWRDQLGIYYNPAESGIITAGEGSNYNDGAVVCMHPTGFRSGTPSAPRAAVEATVNDTETGKDLAFVAARVLS